MKENVTLISQYINKEHEFEIEHIHVLCHVVEHAGYHLGQVTYRNYKMCLLLH